jgi:hypothetical protein
MPNSQLIFFNADAQQAEMATWGPPIHLTLDGRMVWIREWLDIYSHSEAMEKTYDETVTTDPGREGVYVWLGWIWGRNQRFVVAVVWN